ncbi:hypothetical protein MWN34_14020 [Ancylobacter sp. 6x-1]|uniref:Uncharacterized protein n=1 Tax=Ancylobacter crimeensis TaxID=2579147 RepID=A0ABT0DDK0_9HYPH|nr:hypothetical protein [Ancylobacter crimeensis]MCK0198027.1 hypothetical protein [Ancylobacter crimeensis]
MRLSSALIACACLMPSIPALADQMDAQQARSFVVGRTFSYKCYEGTVGAGRILDDGSVAGTIQMRGQGTLRFVTLPAGTLITKGSTVCARMKGMMFEPCFDLEKTSEVSFRGNLSGFAKLACEFNRGGAGRARLASNRNKTSRPTTTAQVEARN